MSGMWSWYWAGPNPQSDGYQTYVTEVSVCGNCGARARLRCRRASGHGGVRGCLGCAERACGCPQVPYPAPIA